MKSLLLLMLVAVPAASQTPTCAARPVVMGCANAANLAAMLANPADLTAPQPAAPAMGAATLLPIERYRTGKLLPLPEVGTDGADGGTVPK
jgi:type IV pilus biogenesis protein CpaD/CtpE